jgi:aspartate/methionine/tyrosine aminotransferase
MGGATSLTQMQLLGVGSGTNVAEGYPRFALTHTQRGIVERFPALLAEAIATPFPVLEARAHHALFDALGQHSAPIGTGRILSYYASTVAIDVIGGCLASVTSKVAVISPVLDCIPALFRHRGLQLEGLTEGRLASTDPLAGLDGIGAVVVASPNNPTGTVITAPQMRRLAEACVERDVILVIDQCFRAFDPRAQFDTIALLDESGVDYVVVEDTGKLWPVGGIKLGFTIASEHSRLDLATAASDVLLTAPPFATVVVEAFAHDMGNGGLERLQARIAANRAALREELEGCDFASVADGNSRASVSRIGLAKGLTGTRLWGQLLRMDVHAVPCRPFYWSRSSQGERYLRIALARETDVVRRAGRAVRACVEDAAT